LTRASDAALGIELDDAQRRLDADGKVETQEAHRVAKLGTVTVGSVGEDDLARDFIADSAFDHVEGQLDLRLEGHCVGDLGLVAPRGVFGPGLGQVEFEVEGKLLGGGRGAQADADLTVGDLAGRAGVLPLHADGVLALLEKAGVVDDPGSDGFATSELVERVAGSFSTYGEVVPDTPSKEVAELAVQIVSFSRVS